MFDQFGLDVPPQVIRPQELGERRRILGVATRAPQFAGERAVGIVGEVADVLGNAGEGSASALRIEGVKPVAIVHERPEEPPVEIAEIREGMDQHLRHALFVEGTREMVVVEHPVALLGADHDGDHMAAEERATPGRGMFSPLASLALDLAIADRHLGRPQLVDSDGAKRGFERLRHRHFSFRCVPFEPTTVHPSAVIPAAPLDAAAHVVQLALTPIFLLAGLATLLNVFTVRLGRVADRVDLLAKDADTHRGQLRRLRARSMALDIAVILGALAGGLTCCAALTLFFGALRRAAAAWLLFGLFGGALVCATLALAAFAFETLLSGRSVREEAQTGSTRDPKPRQ